MANYDFELMGDLNDVFRRSAVCKFLYFCNKEGLAKNILDCGAGAITPPLALFHAFGYETHGIDIDDDKIRMSLEFQNEHKIDLDIIQGDMRDLPYEDGSFSFVYSFNTIFHMDKKDVGKSIREMRRVLRPEGLMYLNLLSVDDGGYGTGTKIGPGEFIQNEGGREVIHSYFEDKEGDEYFDGMQTILKQKRIGYLDVEGIDMRYAYIDYFLRI